MQEIWEKKAPISPSLLLFLSLDSYFKIAVAAPICYHLFHLSLVATVKKKRKEATNLVCLLHELELCSQTIAFACRIRIKSTCSLLNSILFSALISLLTITCARLKVGAKKLPFELTHV